VLLFGCFDELINLCQNILSESLHRELDQIEVEKCRGDEWELMKVLAGVSTSSGNAGRVSFAKHTRCESSHDYLISVRLRFDSFGPNRSV
jgi:hypothetical protein